MARVRYMRARKSKDKRTCKRCGQAIKPGDMYFTWTNRIGTSSVRRFQCEKHRPRPSDVTTSDKKSRLYRAREDVEDLMGAWTAVADLTQALRDAATTAEEVADEYNESADNMPDGLRESSVADGLRESADSAREWAEALTAAADEIEGMDEPDAEDETHDEFVTDAETAANNALDELNL